MCDGGLRVDAALLSNRQVETNNDAPQAQAQVAACPVCGNRGRLAGVKRGYDHYACSSCKSLFVWPVPSTYLDTYQGSYFSGAANGHGYVEYDRDKLPMSGTFLAYLDLLAQHGCKTGRLLDIGAATGFFLNLARSRGYETMGVEPGEDAVTQARSKHLNVIHGTLSDLREASESFDAATMLDVLEHLPEPRATLGAVHKLLKPGGLLAINTPDQGSALAKTLGMRWHLVTPPEHLCLFTAGALKSALQQTGFEVLVLNRIGKKFTLQYIVQTLAMNWRIAAPLAEYFRGRAIGHLGVPINFRDNVFVLARKL
jgi:SAM-dependent methyltransferase